MERKNKACWNCYFYDAYYTKATCSFEKQSLGFCKYKQTITKNEEVCEKQIKVERKRQPSKAVAYRSLIKICQNLEELKQIFIEETEE